MKNISRILFFVLILGYSCNDNTVLENPVLPVLSVADIEVSETNTNASLDIVIQLEGENRTNVKVDYSTLEGTAIIGSDYEGAIGQLIFAPGESSKTVTVRILGDFVDEPIEKFEFIMMNPVNATMENNRATITILNDDEGFENALTIPETGYSTPTLYPGMELVWSDEFQGEALDPNDWTYEIGNGASGWGNNELQFYKEENAYLALGDYLVIEAKEENESGFDYTSARIITAGKKEFQYGRIDIRAALPKGRGMWPATWMLGSDFYDVGWPTCGEIDIMELIGHNNHIVHGTVHFGENPSEAASVGASRITPSGDKFDEAFHVFSLIWEEDRIRILVDDNMYLDVDPSALGGKPWPFNQPFFFIFNVAVGGNWPGDPDENTIFPQVMVVDYVRVFQ